MSVGLKGSSLPVYHTGEMIAWWVTTNSLTSLTVCLHICFGYFKYLRDGNWNITQGFSKYLDFRDFLDFFLKFSATKGKNGSGLTLSCCRDFILKYAMKIYNNSFCWSKTGVFKGLSGNFVWNKQNLLYVIEKPIKLHNGKFRIRHWGVIQTRDAWLFCREIFHAWFSVIYLISDGTDMLLF